jgi:pimeloyl-ACP methyl ester carboxylesterase
MTLEDKVRAVSEGSTVRRATIGEQLVAWREAPPASGAPVLYVHGVPTSSSDWEPFLARTGGLAPDLPGFGHSGKRGDGDYTMEGYDVFVERFLAHAGAERVRLVIHDWGAAALLWAQRHPERVERLVVMNAVPLLPGYRWHRVARVWRTPVAGEILVGLSTRATMGRFLPAALRDDVFAHFDQGTQRAILRLYRSSPPERLAHAGARLARLRCPALVLWGDRDRYIAPRFADAYAAALGGPAEVVHVPAAGHWPWLDAPDVVERVAGFLDG